MSGNYFQLSAPEDVYGNLLRTLVTFKNVYITALDIGKSSQEYTSMCRVSSVTETIIKDKNYGRIYFSSGMGKVMS